MITIRHARLADAAILRRLEDEIWAETCVTSRYDMATFIKIGYTFVAICDNRIVGAIVAIRSRQHAIRILDIFVKLEYRRQHVGIQLIQALVRRVLPLTVESIVRDDNHGSLRLHRSAGFHKIRSILDPYALGDTIGHSLLMHDRTKPIK